jgi:hypothetical protein
MKMGAEDKKKLGILAVVGVLALGAVFYMYSELSAPDVARPVTATVTVPAKAPVSRPARTGEARSVGTSATHLDPTLHMKPMLVTESLVYSGTGRNIFSASSAPPVVIPKAVASARPKSAAAAPPVRLGPPPPPPIDLKFFGTETSAKGVRRAFLLHGEDVFLASPGDIVQRRYKIGTISANSVVVEDLTDNNMQTLPLLAQ